LDGLVLAHNPRFVQLLEAAGERVRVIGGVRLAETRTRVEETTVVSRSSSPR
jgi:hypothetical protein